MDKNIYGKLTNEELVKKQGQIKGVAIGFAVIYAIALGVLVYLFTQRGSKNISIATLIPILILPVTFVPVLIHFGLLKKELKSRNG